MGVALLGEAVEGTGCDVEVAVCGGEDEDEDAGVAVGLSYSLYRLRNEVTAAYMKPGST